MISDQELDKLEISRQKDSDWILQKLNLISTLEKYGQVRIAGAKALGLMYAKDIDISVIARRVRIEDWQELVKELMVTPYVRNVSAIDYYNYDEQNRYDPDNGQKYSLFISINNIIGPENDKYDTWDCQIHLIEPNMFDETKITGIARRLTPEKRLVVLRLKHWANSVNKILMPTTNNNFKIFSPSIYNAVLDKNIDSVEEFIKFYRQTISAKFQKVFDRTVNFVSKEF
jgi:hypothetical protein